MSYETNRQLAQIVRRLDMMLSRGVLVATSDEDGIQTMQMALLEGEIADEVERFQSYGISAVPPPGGDALVAFVAGNRDHGICVAVNDRESRPKGLKAGEVVLYNDKECFVSLSTDGDVIVRGARNLAIEGVENIEIKSGEALRIEAGQGIVLTAGEGIVLEAGSRIDLNAPGGAFVNGEPINTGP